MERVVFIMEETGERIGCLLNPESVVLRRQTGVSARRAPGGLVTGTDMADDPVQFTGGGSTQLSVDLLFDISLAGSTIASEDIRDLTGPLWELAENARGGRHTGRPPLARFVWGKAWNFPGVVTAVAERLEYFSPAGVPQRSWLRLRMARVAETAAELAGGAISPPVLPETLPDRSPTSLGDEAAVHEITGWESLPDDVQTISGERLDELAFRYYGDASLWRLLAWANGVLDPLRLSTGQLLQVPTGSDLGNVQ